MANNLVADRVAMGVIYFLEVVNIKAAAGRIPLHALTGAAMLESNCERFSRLVRIAAHAILQCDRAPDRRLEHLDEGLFVERLSDKPVCTRSNSDQLLLAVAFG